MTATRTPLRFASLGFALAALTLALSASLGAAAPAAEAAQPEAPGGPTAEAAKRKPYPPARLWYRVSARFAGQVGNGAPSGNPRREFDSSWRVGSRTAVRLTLLCVNRRIRPDTPFQYMTRVRGRKRRVGGCPAPTRRKPRLNLRTTLRFAAGVDGEMRSWKMVGTRANDDCGEWNFTSDLVGPQALDGTIKSANSAIDGIGIGVAPSGQPGPVVFHEPALTCVSANTGNPYSVPAKDSTRRFGELDLFGIESWVGGELVSERLRLAPGRFGRGFSVAASLSQEQDRGRALPPSGPYFEDPFAAKSYRWKIRFQPCPGGGRKVKRC
jgi:hypothetical protein